MASQMFENMASIENDFEGLKGIMDSALLMSLMEESQGGDPRDEDRLNSLIRSLEAEIKSVNTMDGTDQDFTLEGHGENIVGDQECHMSSSSLSSSSCDHDHEYGWGDMDIVPCPSSPSDDGSWYTEVPFGISEIDHGLIIHEFGGEQSYNSNIYIEEALGENGYGSLWQDSYSSELVMCD